MNILITGGTVYIGSHTSIILTKAGHKITIVDNLCNSNIEVIGQLIKIIGSKVNFINGDVRNTSLMTDWAISDSAVKVSILRCFNPVGAHESGLIGEYPNQSPNNLIPYIIKVISGSLTHLNIYGNDYETRDGTGERDYIHMMDLDEGHLAALGHLKNNFGVHIYNLGMGHSTTVLELIKIF